MAEKKLFWLKLKNDFFQQKHIKKLRKIAGGDTYTIIYLKLQLLSLKTNATILYEDTEEDIVEQLALEIDEKEENVKITLSFLQSNNLIEVNTENDIKLLETQDLIHSESDSAKRVREHRKRKKTLQCNTLETKCNTDIDIELEKDIDIELEKEEEKYFENFEINNLFKDFLKTRPKKVNTELSIKKLINKTKGFTDEEIKQAIDNAIAGGYKSIFPKKSFNTKEEIKPDWLGKEPVQTNNEDVDDSIFEVFDE